MNSLELTGVFDIPTLQSRAVFTTQNTELVFREEEDITPVRIDDRLSYMPWGADNKMPYNVMDLIERDETMTTCLQFVSELCYGSGLHYNTDACTPETKSKVDDFLLDNFIPSYFMGVSQDLKHYAFAVSVIILNAEGTEIVSLCRKNACYCRFSPAEDGVIKQVLYANWRRSVVDKKDIEVIELLNPSSPWRDLAVRMGRRPGSDGKVAMRTKTRKFAILTSIPTPDSTYYPIPFYASLFRSKWYDIKRLIATAKKSKLQNAAPIKYHIEVSAKYFDGIFKREGITDRKKQQEKVVAVKKEILDFLTGVENSGKVWFSTYYVTPDGKEQHDIQIHKIDTNKEGGDWESDIQEAVNMMCFALRVHSNLVGSVPGKSQSNNSGSDKRELYTIAQALQKPYHDMLFAPHRMIIKFNGWEGAQPECPFIQLTTLDENRDAKLVKPVDADTK